MIKSDYRFILTEIKRDPRCYENFYIDNALIHHDIDGKEYENDVTKDLDVFELKSKSKVYAVYNTELHKYTKVFKISKTSE